MEASIGTEFAPILHLFSVPGFTGTPSDVRHRNGMTLLDALGLSAGVDTGTLLIRPDIS
jgi:hypothetical protein